MMSKKILIHSLIFSPDGVSTAYLYNDIALRFQECGYEVVVLTTTPHYNLVADQLAKQPLKWKIWGICKQSNFNGIKVIHIPQKKFKSTVLRLLGFAYWHVIALLIGVFIRNISIILSPSPPLTIGIINLCLSRLKKCKVVYNVQEIYPDILNKKNGLVVSCLSKMEHYVYRKSSAVTTIDDVFYNTIINRFQDKARLHIIPNFVDTDLYNPSNGDISLLDTKLFPQTSSLKVLYAGNIGYAQDWKPLISVAERLQSFPIDFIVIGEGAMKSFIENEKERLQLKNIHLLPYQHRNLMPSILAYSDLQFIFMTPEMEMQGFPSKVYTIMACGKPLLVCSGEGTPIVNFLNGYNCAKIVTERNYDNKINEMVDWLKTVTKKQLQILGERGMHVIHQKYSKEKVTQQYVDLANSLLDN